MSHSFRAGIVNTVTIVSLCLLFTPGCATKRHEPPPSLATAKLAIDEAKRSRADEYAPSDLELAQSKLFDAQASLDRGERSRARVLTEQATVDAQVAEAKAEANLAWAEATDSQVTAETLR